MNAISVKMLEGMRSLGVEHNPDYPLDDIGIAKLFHTLCNEIACYVPQAKSRYIFDGRRWIKDNGGLSVMELCKSFVQTMYHYTMYTPEENKDFIKYTIGLQSRKRRESILRDACSIAHRNLSEFDSDKLLFNCQNGTLNLATMTM